MTRTIITLAILLSLTACDTIAGAGKDLSTAGSAITDQAKQTKQTM